MVGFYWVGLIFWLLVIVSIILFIIGIVKKNRVVLLSSSVFYLPVGIYLYLASENWIKGFLLIVIIPVIFAIYFNKNKKRYPK